MRQHDEAWRIVSDELWQAAQDVRGCRNNRHVRDAAGKIRRTAIGNSSGRKRLLSGFLECGECGGSYHAVSARLWGCSWHKHRGPTACSNDVKIPEVVLERAVLGAVREALDEEIAAHALDVALADLRERIARAEPTRLEEQLAELDVKIARALDLAIDLGNLDEAKDRLRGLRAERDRVAGELGRVRVDLPTAEELLPRLRTKLRAIEDTLRADVALSRLALGALLGEGRIRVYRDGRIEGLATLGPETLAAPRGRPGAASLGGSGGALRPRLPASRAAAAAGRRAGSVRGVGATTTGAPWAAHGRRSARLRPARGGGRVKVPTPADLRAAIRDLEALTRRGIEARH